MDFNELILFFERKKGISSKTGLPYDFYQIYTVVDGVRVYLFCKDKTGWMLLQNAIRDIDNDINYNKG